MKRSEPFVQGYRCAMRRAVTYLHERAKEMNDPSARAALNTAAFWLGSDAKTLMPSPYRVSDKELAEIAGDP